MTRIFCTIFNSVYLMRGMALMASLRRHCPEHRIYAFAMDGLSAEVLREWGDARVVVVRPEDFEDGDLLGVKTSRSVAEYFWTCTPSIIHHCLVDRGEPECTYVDADVWLLASPEPLFQEMGGASVLLTEHRYEARYDHLAAAYGKYCVQFMSFVRSPEGKGALEWWRARCIEWCFARLEDGRFGDQKYLDDWTERFSGVHVLRHPGGGVAPWNVGRYRFAAGANGVEVREEGGPWQPVVFFHFHGMRSLSENLICYGDGYSLGRNVKAFFYAPYSLELAGLYQRWRSRLSGLAAMGVAPGASNEGTGIRKILKRIRGAPNIYSLRRLQNRAQAI